MGWVHTSKSRYALQGRIAIATLAIATLLLTFGGIWSAGASEEGVADTGDTPTEEVVEAPTVPSTEPPTTAPPTTEPETTTPSSEPPSIVPGPEQTRELSQQVDSSGPQASTQAPVQELVTRDYTGQGTTDGVCNSWDTGTPPVSIGPGEVVWQFNFTGLDNPQPVAGFPRLTYEFSDGTSGSQVTPPDTFTGSVAKWFVATDADATILNAPATFAEGYATGGNPQLTISHCWGQASLTIEKSVVNDPGGLDAFDIHVECDNGETFDFTLTAGTSNTIGVTFNDSSVECTISETNPQGAVVDISPNPVTLTAGTSSAIQVSTVTNTFTNVGGDFTGSVNVEKRVVGGPPADGTQFVVNVHCVGVTIDVSEDITLVYPDSLAGGFSFSAPSVESVQCTVTEKDPLGGAVKASISPNDGVVTLTVNAPVSDVVVTNEYGDPVVQVGGTSATLPFTGSSTSRLLTAGIVLLVGGGALSLLARVRRRSASAVS